MKNTPIINDIKTMLQSELLKNAVKVALSCKMCQQILDFRRAVLFQEPTFVLCAGCFEITLDSLDAHHGQGTAFEMCHLRQKEGNIVLGAQVKLPKGKG